MGFLRSFFFLSCFALGFMLAACAGSGKDESTSIMKASGAGPVAKPEACAKTSESDTQIKKDSCKAGEKVDESQLASKEMNGSAYCVAGFSANLKSDEKKVEIKDLVDGQEGAWDLVKVQTYVDIKDTSTQEVNQLAGATTDAKLSESGSVSQDGATISCHTSLAQADSGEKVSADSTPSSMEDWNALQTHTDFPASISRKDGSITTRRYDYWKADHGQIKTGSSLYQEPSQIGASSDTNSFAGVNDVTVAMNAEKTGFDVIVKTNAMPDGKHQVIVFTRATYKGTQALSESRTTEQKETTTQTTDSKDQTQQEKQTDSSDTQAGDFK